VITLRPEDEKLSIEERSYESPPVITESKDEKEIYD
jgi:hypothetical protein